MIPSISTRCRWWKAFVDASALTSSHACRRLARTWQPSRRRSAGTSPPGTVTNNGHITPPRTESWMLIAPRWRWASHGFLGVIAGSTQFGNQTLTRRIVAGQNRSDRGRVATGITFETLGLKDPG